MSFEIPVELKKAICNDQLIVFVGAGLSYDLVNINNEPIKGWGNLVEQILNHLKKNGHDVDHLVPLIEKVDPVKILDLIESDKKLPKTEIYEFVKDFLDLDQEKNDFSLHKKLSELSKKIITTNYDTAFELASPELRKQVAYIGKSYEFTSLRDPKKSLLFKLHGCFLDSKSMVLFPTNYSRLYNSGDLDSKHARTVLKNIIHNNIVLFIGSGMSDFQINTLFKEVKNLQGEFNQKHFIISNKTLDSSLNFLERIPVSSHSEIIEVIGSLLEYKNQNCEDPDKELLKKELAEARKEIALLKSKDRSTHSELVERAAIEYFSSGLEYHLEKDYESAIEKYEMAFGLMPILHIAQTNMGNALGEMAKSKKGEEQEKLYIRAFEKYNTSVKIQPNHQAYYNWGTEIAEFAKTKPPKRKEQLLLKSFEKFKAAIDLKPDKHQAFYNWGSNLNELANLKEGDEKKQLLNEAFEKLKEGVLHGGKKYNLACMYMIRNEETKAFKLLDESLIAAEITAEFVLKDPDWKTVFDNPKFKEIITKHRKG